VDAIPNLRRYKHLDSPSGLDPLTKTLVRSLNTQRTLLRDQGRQYEVVETIVEFYTKILLLFFDKKNMVGPLNSFMEPLLEIYSRKQAELAVTVQDVVPAQSGELSLTSKHDKFGLVITCFSVGGRTLAQIQEHLNLLETTVTPMKRSTATPLAWIKAQPAWAECYTNEKENIRNAIRALRRSFLAMRKEFDRLKVETADPNARPDLFVQSSIVKDGLVKIQNLLALPFEIILQRQDASKKDDEALTKFMAGSPEDLEKKINALLSNNRELCREYATTLVGMKATSEVFNLLRDMSVEKKHLSKVLEDGLSLETILAMLRRGDSFAAYASQLPAADSSFNSGESVDET
jgi:hypothetical protein